MGIHNIIYESYISHDPFYLTTSYSLVPIKLAAFFWPQGGGLGVVEVIDSRLRVAGSRAPTGQLARYGSRTCRSFAPASCRTAGCTHTQHTPSDKTHTHTELPEGRHWDSLGFPKPEFQNGMEPIGKWKHGYDLRFAQLRSSKILRTATGIPWTDFWIGRSEYAGDASDDLRGSLPRGWAEASVPDEAEGMMHPELYIYIYIY